MRKQPSLTIVMGVVDSGDFSCVLPLGNGKKYNRFVCSGQPALMGAHVYTENTEGVALCSLRINNGTLERDAAGKWMWHGIVRYDSLRITAPHGNVIVTEDGEITPTLTLHTGDILSFLPRATISQRFAVCRPELIALAAIKLRMEDLEDHQWQPLKGSYGPSKILLPNVDNQNYEASSLAEYEAWVNAWRTGEPKGGWESVAPRIGPRMGAGESAAYTHGGNGIDVNHGYEQCRGNTLLRRFKHNRWMDRMNVAIFDGRGRQLTVLDINTSVQQINGPGFWQGQNDLSTFLGGEWGDAQYPQFNPGSSTNADEWNVRSIDTAHMIRAASNGIAVWEYTRDPMIADDLVMLFENTRFTEFSDREDAVPHDPSYTAPSINAMAYQINLNPHDGAEIDRGFAWSLYLGAQVHRMGFDRTSWLSKMVSLMDEAVMPNGIVGTYHSDYFPANTTGIQTFHEMLVWMAYHAAQTQLKKSPAAKLTAVCTTILDMPSINDEYWQGTVKGPPHWIWTHVNSVPVPVSVANSNGGGDAAHTNHLLALTYMSTRRVGWLDVSLRHWFVASSREAKLADLRAMSDKSWGACLEAVLALAQPKT